jgi:hypothetical protein
MKRFTSPGHTQQFLSTFSGISPYFRPPYLAHTASVCCTGLCGHGLTGRSHRTRPRLGLACDDKLFRDSVVSSQHEGTGVSVNGMSPVFQRIQDLLRSDPATLVKADAEFSAMRQARGFHHEGRSYPVSLQPFVLDPEWADAARSASEELHRVLERVADLYREDEEVRRFFGPYRRAERWLTAAPSVRPCAGVCRFDGVFIDGTYRVMETNTCCPGGVIKVGAQFPLWQSVVAEMLGVRPPESGGQPFVTDPMLFVRHLVRMHELQFNAFPAGAGVVSLNGRYTNEIDLTVAGLDELGVPARHLDATALRRVSGGKVSAGGFEVSLAYHKLDQLEFINSADCFDYLDAGAAGDLCFLNPLLAQCVLEDKSVLALISDPRFSDRFGTADQIIIERHVPWTRLVTPGNATDPAGRLISLPEFIIDQRARLIIKPCNLTRGENVTIGALTTADSWNATVGRAVRSGDYVVQQYLPLPAMEVITGNPPQAQHMAYELDTYLISGRYAGFLCRTSIDPIVNVGRSGIMVPVVIKRADADGGWPPG